MLHRREPVPAPIVTRLGLGRRREVREEIERRVRADLRVARQLKIPRRRTQMPVPEEALNRVEVNATLEQVRG